MTIRLWIVAALGLALTLAGCGGGEPGSAPMAPPEDEEAWLRETVEEAADTSVYSTEANGATSLWPSVRLVPRGYYLDDPDDTLREAARIFRALFRYAKVKDVELVYVDNDFPEPARELLYLRMSRETFDSIDWDDFDPVLLPDVLDTYEKRA